MGNRAVIMSDNDRNGLGVYVHWNGGRDCIEGFLAYCDAKGYRAPDTDNYGWARLCQVIGNFFGGTLSVGIDVGRNLDRDNGDNGTYYIKGWKVVGREFFKGSEPHGIVSKEDLEYLNGRMPEHDRLTDEEINRYVAEKLPKYNEQGGN